MENYRSKTKLGKESSEEIFCFDGIVPDTDLMHANTFMQIDEGDGFIARISKKHYEDARDFIGKMKKVRLEVSGFIDFLEKKYDGETKEEVGKKIKEKECLTRKQMDELRELGISNDGAKSLAEEKPDSDCRLVTIDEVLEAAFAWQWSFYKTFVVHDLLNMIPKEIDGNFIRINRIMSGVMWVVRYESNSGNELIRFSNINLIDALFKTVKYFAVNGRIKNGKRKSGKLS